MNVSREIKKEEAIKRMRAMHIIPDAIKQFKNDDVVMVSEPPLGGLYWLNDEEKKWYMSLSKKIMLLCTLL